MKLRPFELVLVVVFIGLALLSLLFLSTYKNNSDGEEEFVVGSVQIWGTLDRTVMGEIITKLRESNKVYSDVTYRYIDPNDLNMQLVNALADGVGPDLLLTSHEQLITLRNRLTPVTYESVALRDVRSTYIDGAEIFALSDGLYAYPITVDPLMLYWNRDLLTTAGFLAPPQTWEDLVNTYTTALTTREFDRTITQSAVALGEYENIRNSFGIISALLIQAGSGLVEETGTEYHIKLNESIAAGAPPLRSVADFYTRFSRPNNTLYSWNRSFTEDRAQFISEDLALYFGYASEGYEIERLNPNLNFDIAELPQGAAATIRRTYGKFYGVSLVRNADNVPGAAAVMRVLAGSTYAQEIANRTGMVPVLRELVARGSDDTYGRLGYRSAPVAYGWLNPSRPAVDAVFTTMTRDITEGRYTESEAAEDAVTRLEQTYN